MFLLYSVLSPARRTSQIGQACGGA